MSSTCKFKIKCSDIGQSSLHKVNVHIYDVEARQIQTVTLINCIKEMEALAGTLHTSISAVCGSGIRRRHDKHIIDPVFIMKPLTVSEFVPRCYCRAQT
jgi:hypothetical protein